jgi:hypothetical protein
MITWADYLIKNVKFVCVDGKHYINEVEVLTDNDDLGQEGFWWSREKIISLIKIGNSFCFIFKGENWWIPGPYLTTYYVDGNCYLKTLGNGTEAVEIVLG